MTAKLKNRIKNMNFQKQNNREIKVEEREDTKYYEEIEKSKLNSELQGEYFFYFLYGKYYNTINK